MNRQNLQKTGLKILLLLSGLEGTTAVWFLFREESMERNALIGSYSLPRVLLGVTAGLAAVLLIFTALKAHFQPQWSEWIVNSFKEKLSAFSYFTPLVIGLAFSAAGCLIAVAASHSLALPNYGMIPAVVRRSQSLLLWASVMALQGLGYLLIALQPSASPTEANRSLIYARSLIVLTGLSLTGFLLTAVFARKEIALCFGLISLALATSAACFKFQERLSPRGVLRMRGLVIFTIFLALYTISTAAVQRYNSPSKVYFDQLALSFLNGKLYLDQPATTMDLTFVSGHWYVAFPPLPALIMLPIIAIVKDPARFNSVLFSILFAAANVGLIFMILETLTQRGWSKLRTSGNLWLTMLFGLGSAHWYMAFAGTVWFLSQILTVTFAALSTLIAVSGGSIILSGTALGVAMLARPNLGFAFPILLGAEISNRLQKNGSFKFKDLIDWGLRFFLPVSVSAAVLLGYNFLRFGSPLDFGYTNMNVGASIKANLLAYGQFNPHFIARNLQVMWIALPKWNPTCGRLVPSPQGMGLLITMPILVVALRAFKKDPLILGCWATLGVIVVLLSMYFNTGYWQFGYRFSMDFILALMILLAVGARERLTGWMKLLIVYGVLVNAIGMLWYYGFWC